MLNTINNVKSTPYFGSADNKKVETPWFAKPSIMYPTASVIVGPIVGALDTANKINEPIKNVFKRENLSAFGKNSLKAAVAMFSTLVVYDFISKNYISPLFPSSSRKSD